MKEIKALSLRLPLKTWKFLKKESIDQQLSVNQIIQNMIEEYKKSNKNKLTKSDAVVSYEA